MLETIQQLNDQAVSSLQQNQMNESKALLSKALELLREMTQLIHTQQDKDSVSSSSSSSPSSSSSSQAKYPPLVQRVEKVSFLPVPGTLQEELALYDDMHSHDNIMNDDAEEGFHFFPRSFVFGFSAPFDFRWVFRAQGPQPSIDSVLAPTPSQRALCCAACFYNLALVYHLEYYEQSRQQQQQQHTDQTATAGSVRRRDESLGTAYHLYEAACFILLDFTDLVPGDSVMILYMAVCTNLAAVSYAKADLVKCQHWKDQLIYSLSLCHLHHPPQDLFHFVASASLPDFYLARAA